MQLFYSNLISIPVHTLTPDESKHCIHVLRLSVGDNIYIVNGKGNLYKSVIIESNAKKCQIEIIEELPIIKHNYHLHVAIAPTKSMERFEWFIEKAVEIGIDEITPIICERSERKVIKNERIEKIAIAAMKQSLKAYLPTINEITRYNDFIGAKRDAKKCIAYCGDVNDKILLQNHVKPQENAVILIGPEGDFSPQEIDMALNNDYQSISLGKSRLRTETAGIAACHTISLINQI